MSALVTHLWSSTLLLVVVLVCARLLPLTARTRYALLLCGLFKFLVPAEAILAPLRAIGLDLSKLGARSQSIISIQWLGAPSAVLPAATQESARWPQVVLIAWLITAVTLAVAWAIARHRLVSSALKAASPASTRERDLLAAARRRLGLTASVDITRSTIYEAPAVVRIIRPVVVLPDGGCDALDDSELESLLRHECAHVARRDNLLGLLESAIVAAFWFNPVVWFAQRALATAREEACDETAAVTSDSIDTYISALSKICRAVLAPRLAGVSCMASAHLKERLNHLMRYELLRKRALPYPAVIVMAAVAVLAVAAGSGLHAAPANDGDKFQFQFTARPGERPTYVEVEGRVFETATGLTLSRPHVMFPRNTSASIRTDAAEKTVFIQFRADDSAVTADLRIASESGELLQESKHTIEIAADAPRDTSGRRYTGAPISITLKDADIKDVLRTFSKVIDTEIVYPPDLKGAVDLNVKDMPWDEALDVVLRQHGLSYRLDGKRIIVER